MPNPLVVFTTCHPWIQKVVAEVRPAGFDTHFLDINDAQATRSILPQADFLVCLKLTEQQTRLLTNCKLVMLNGVGYDGIPIDILHEMQIPVAITPTYTAEGVAEHALMLMLALSKQLPAVQQSMRAGKWNMFGWRQHSHTLHGKTVGIIGLGRIGKHVAHLVHAFGCRVVYNDIIPIPTTFQQRYNLARLDFNTLLQEADIITVHVPLTPLTRKFIGHAEFAQMKPTAMFINTSRGATYDLDALYKAITSGNLLGAGVDVYDPEPPRPDHPIFHLPRVICTPHIASGTVERQYAINRAHFANCQRILDGLTAENLIPEPY